MKNAFAVRDKERSISMCRMRDFPVSHYYSLHNLDRLNSSIRANHIFHAAASLRDAFIELKKKKKERIKCMWRNVHKRYV